MKIAHRLMYIKYNKAKNNILCEMINNQFCNNKTLEGQATKGAW